MQSINWSVFCLITAIFLFLWHLRVSDHHNSFSSNIKQLLRGNEGLDNLFLAVSILHIVETVFIYIICRFWGKFSMSDTILYMVLCIFGGIFVVKAAANRSTLVLIQDQNLKPKQENKKTL